MATLLSRDWTGADGATWEAVGFSRILGSALNAAVLSNTGRCGAVAAERFYAALGYPASPNHKPSIDLDWGNAVGSTRVPGIGVRWSADGDDGYLAEVDSNFDAPQVRLRRRRGGAWTTLVDWVDLSVAPFLLDGADLEAAVTLQLRVENETDQVSLVVRISDVVVIEHDDTDAERIEGSGLIVVKIDGLSTLGDVTYDNLIVEDFEDEASATPTELDERIALVVDGVYYSWDELVAAKIFVGTGRQSYTRGDGWEFRTPQLMDADDAILYPGAVVQVASEGVVQASGRIKSVARRLQPGEGRAFALRSSRDLAADVYLSHPTTGANTIQWNLKEGHADYDAAFADKTVGEAIAQVLDAHADGDTGLRAHLAAPPDELDEPYVQAELDLLTAKVPGMSGSTDPVACVEQLLSFTKYALFIDPATRVWHIKDRLAGTIHQVSIDTDHVLGEYVVDLDRNFTAVVIVGERPEAVETELANGGGGLVKGWDASLEATHTAEKAVTNRAEGVVQSTSGSGASVGMTPNPASFSMDAHEWKRCVLGFLDGPEEGNTYDLTGNTSVAFAVVGPWLAGGPDPGDLFVVSGNAAGGGRDNGHVEMGRRYLVDDVTKGIRPDACAGVRVVTDKLDKLTAALFETPTDPAEKASVLLDLPTIGLVNYTPEGHSEPCLEGGAVDEAEARVTLPLYTRADPRVPTLWFPQSGGGKNGYRGTSFTTDPAKWDAAGKPGKGDPGVMRPYPLPAAEYDGTAAQSDEWEIVCAEILAFLSPVARSVTIEIANTIDTSFAGLGCRLQVLGGPPELETLTDLTVLAVEWDVARNVTRVFAGTLAAGEYDMQQMRREMVARNVKRREQRDFSRIQEVLDCLEQNRHSANYAPGKAPVQICGEEVTTGVTKPERSAKEDITQVNLFISFVWDWIFAQKGYTVTTDDAGNLWVQDPDGNWTYSLDGGETWLDDFDNNGPAGGVNGAGDAAADNPIPDHPDDLADDSIEGIMWNAIEGILANLGKTVDAEGNVLAPGTIAAAGGTTYGHDLAGDITETPLAPGGTVPPTTLGGLAANKAAMEELLLGHTPSTPPGTITAPGGAVYVPSVLGYLRSGLGSAGLNLAAPVLGGAVGGLAGKCGSTFDGAGTFGSGPGTILEPGTIVGEDGAYYHPPTDDPADVTTLEPGDEVPASTQQQAAALAAEDAHLVVHDAQDLGGVVYVDEHGAAPTETTRYWRCEPATVQFREVEETPGVGLNAGDWSWVHPAVYHETKDAQVWKRPARMATTAALAANTAVGTTVLEANAVGALATIDTVAPAVGDRVLVKNEVSSQKNGLYVVTSLGGATKWKLTRTSDADTVDDLLPGMMVFVAEGSVNHGRVFLQANLGPITPHTTTQDWEQMPAGVATVADSVTPGGVDLAALDAEASQVQWGAWMGKTNPAANTAAQVIAFPQAGSTMVLPAGAQLVAISAMFTGSFTVGEATFRIKKNGSADTALELDVTGAVSGFVTGAGASFDAGDFFGGEMDTNATYNGTSGQWNVLFWFKIDRVS